MINNELTKPDGVDVTLQQPEAQREQHWQIKETWTIPSTEASIKSATQQFATLIERVPSEDDKFWLQMGFDEAVINAVKHGNESDPLKNVEIKIDISPATATLIIKDQGAGFQREEISDPTTEEGKKKTSGRGITIYENKFEVKYNKTENGMEITLVKQLNQASPETGAK